MITMIVYTFSIIVFFLRQLLTWTDEFVFFCISYDPKSPPEKWHLDTSKQPMSSAKYPPSLASTSTPTKPPSVSLPPMYHLIGEEDFDSYVHLWLMNNMVFTDTDEYIDPIDLSVVYQYSLEKYG